MTKEQREQLRAMCNAATPGSWTVDKSGRFEDHDECYVLMGATTVEMFSYEDAELTAHARTALPELLDALDATEGRVEALERALRGDCCYCDHEACKLPCGCINGNGWRFANKEDDTL